MRLFLSKLGGRHLSVLRRVVLCKFKVVSNSATKGPFGIVFDMCIYMHGYTDTNCITLIYCAYMHWVQVGLNTLHFVF